MMQGVVDSSCEATLSHIVVNTNSVGNTNQQRQVINAVIDTGFNGFLTLPSTVITAVNLPWNASDIVTLGDGSETTFD
ncbi:MAG: hypothetical protein HC895_14690 [Leptolyngbyaceae cyanobacterium SM1_3_5]|nr:hypothetical protein [Leptolyngbyaceae cyanobacterium SM1_3_5]